MEAPLTPENEARRQKALDALNILDSEPEERYDCIVRLAARLLDAPIANLTFVDNARQWFKASHGLQLSETSRDISFCGHTILSEGPLIVRDTLKDPRFVDNPLVTDNPRIRFYAGQPIKSPDGYPVGTLCVIDRHPRQELSDSELDSLRDLAFLIETHLMERITATPTGSASKHDQHVVAEYEAILTAGGRDEARIVVGAQQNLERFTAAAGEFFAIDQSDIGRSIKDIPSFLLYPSMHADLLNAIDHGEVSTRVVQSINGKKLRARLLPFRPPASARQSVVISLTDITGNERASLLEHALDGVDSEVVVIDQTGKIIFTNAAWDRVAGDKGYPLELQASVGGNYLDLCRPNSGGRGYQEGLNALRQVMAGERTGFTLAYECSLPRGKSIYLMRVQSFSFDGLSIVISHQDITLLLEHGVDMARINFT